MSTPAHPGAQPLRAVIFDVDGVLVRSMERHAEAYQRAFAPYGLDLRESEVFANEGRGSREVAVAIAREHKMGLGEPQLDEIAKEKQRIFLSFGPMPKYPGVDEVVDRLKARGYRLALVTGTNRTNLKHHFGDWLSHFDVIVSAEDVKHTKPDPEPYLKALDKLGLSPGEAVVIENAPLGVQSAKAAGLRVIAITTTNPHDVLAQADTIISSIRNVEDHL